MEDERTGAWTTRLPLYTRQALKEVICWFCNKICTAGLVLPLSVSFVYICVYFTCGRVTWLGGGVEVGGVSTISEGGELYTN